MDALQGVPKLKVNVQIKHNSSNLLPNKSKDLYRNTFSNNMLIHHENKKNQNRELSKF